MRGLLLVSLALVAGCDVSHDRSDAEIARIAKQETGYDVRRLEARIGQLERQVAEQDRQTAIVRDLALSTSKAHDSLVQTFNGNVRKDNEDAVRDMTRRGACGTELITFPSGGTTWRNKECTRKDLR